MQTLYEILGLIGAVGIVFLLYSQIKNRPDIFNKVKMSQSFYTMGILALLLIGFVAFLILLVRMG
ncbi:MAG: hypothetical protein Q8R79_02490 [Legionellaceae bacterium]|nr:hypothetical protein [Legionellaceae bacterium]